MIVPDVRARMAADSNQRYQVVITGIEAHICVSQTALDLLADGHSVYVLADGVSSSHRAQVRIALDRLARAGAVVTTSEAWLYEFLGDAKHEKYVPSFSSCEEGSLNTRQNGKVVMRNFGSFANTA